MPLCCERLNPTSREPLLDFSSVASEVHRKAVVVEPLGAFLVTRPVRDHEEPLHPGGLRADATRGERLSRMGVLAQGPGTA